MISTKNERETTSMTPIAILTDDEKISYDTPATLTAEARGLCFSVSADLGGDHINLTKDALGTVTL